MNKDTKQNHVCFSCFSTIEFPGTIIEQNGKCNRCNSQDFEEKVKHQTISNLTELRSVANKLKEKSPGKYN